MSGSSSPMNGGYEAATAEPTMRLTVRKDLFPEVRLPKLSPVVPHKISVPEDVSCVKLETDFEQSIDEIANQKLQVNGAMLSPIQPRHRKHKQHSRHSSKSSRFNGTLDKQHKKLSYYSQRSKLSLQVKGGKNLSLVSSSDYAEEERSVDSDSSDDEVLQPVVKLPYNIPRSGGKPYSHKISQLSKKKGKSKDNHKEKRTYNIIPCSGKPRSMLSICSSRSKKKSKKSERTATYQSQIVDTKTNIKIKIRKTNVHEMVTPTPTSIADIGQRKSKKKRAASPVASESSGEEYDPSRGDTAAAMSVAAPKPRHPPSKTRKTNNTKSKNEKTERSRVSVTEKDTGPQSPWAQSIPEEILIKIFECVVSSQGTLPTVIRLGKVCKLWHIVSCRPELWKNVDLAQYTTEKCKTDYKLVWLLENRLSLCQSLNIAHWKVGNIPWVLACVADYCPGLVELSVAGWSRLTPDQLFDLVQGLPKLQRLDLSQTSETGGSSTCLSAASMTRVAESCGARFTHLTLANNMFTTLPQILSTIATCCPNLEVLDISGARATSHPAVVPLEALQKGCPKMRVFRAANAQLVLANATTSQLMEAPGWSQLEELSIAGEAAAERVGVGEYRLGDEALARLVRGATRLQLLDLRGLQRLSDSGLVRVPAWDLQHLFLGGCNVTRQSNACLELICEKWSHSLLEIDLSWASAERVLDDAVAALADASYSKLRILNLCGSSVSLEPVKKVLLKCQHLESLNLSSCRALPRGMKRLYTGKELQDLKDSLDPQKRKTKEESDNKDGKKKKDVKKSEADSKTDSTIDSSKPDICKSSDTKEETYSQEKLPSLTIEEEERRKNPTSVPESNKKVSDKQEPTKLPTKSSPDSKSEELSISKELETETSDLKCSRSVKNATPKLLSPIAQAKPDSSSTPSSVPSKTDIRSPHFSPVPKPDSLVQNSPEVQMDSIKNNSSWTSGNIKTTPTHRNEGSHLNKMDSYSKLKHGKLIEQCSPTTSLDNKPNPSPETSNVKPNSWNYSPMPKQDNQFNSQRSPYSAQPSPAQPSPYSTQPSPYSTQPSPYSSQPSPYSAQPSPDTSQIVKPDIQKTNSWNTGNFSPMPKHHSPFSPHPSTHASPDPGLGMKSDSLRSNPNRTPGQYSPMSRQDRLHNSPYSPRSSVENVSYGNKRSPGIGNYSPMMRNDCHLPSPEAPQPTRSLITTSRQQDIYGRTVNKPPDLIQSVTADHSNSWGMERFNQVSVSTPSIESLVWGSGGPFANEPPPRTELPSLLHTPPPPHHAWSGLPSFDNSVQRHNNDLSDPWTLGQFRVEPPHQVHNFVEQAISFDTLSGHVDLPTHIPHSFLDDSFTETSRVD